MSDLVSVIVPIYKVEEYLDMCVQSIVDQTYSELEIILVDDGSPDGCSEKCDQWKDQDDRIIVIHKKNGGLSDARNAGLDICTGDYILFVDSDDWIEKDMVRIMHDHMMEDDYDICACGIIDSYTDREVRWATEYYKGDSVHTLMRLYDNTRFPVSAWNKLYKRKCWEELRFPKGKICEDAFTTYLLIDKAVRIIQIPDALYHYRIRENSIMTSSFSKSRMDEEEAWRSNYEYMKTNHPEIYKSAFDFYLLRINRLIKTIPENQIQDFSNEYNRLKEILKNNQSYIIFQSKMPFKQRMKLILNYRKLK